MDNKPFIITISVIIIAALGITGFAAVSSFNATKKLTDSVNNIQNKQNEMEGKLGEIAGKIGEEEPETPADNGETKPEEPANEDDTKGWKTYTDEKYGFEVKYPSGWISGGEDATLSTTFLCRYSENSFCRFNIRVINSTEYNGDIGALRAMGYDYKERDYTIDGISAVRLTKPLTENLKSEDGFSFEDAIYFKGPTNYYRIERYGFENSNDNESKCKETFNKIVSTFKFTK